MGCCAVAGWVDADSVAVLASWVCADAGDALARSHTATANRPRSRNPPITATFVVMIGIERCIAPRSTGHWLHPATYPPSRADKQEQSAKRDKVAFFAPCSPIEREVRALNAECARQLTDSGCGSRSRSYPAEAAASPTAGAEARAWRGRPANPRRGSCTPRSCRWRSAWPASAPRSATCR